MIAWLQFVAGNILVASLIGALAWQVGRRGRHAPIAHLLWVVVFVKLITPPIVLLPIPVPESWLPATQASYTDAIPYQGITVLRGQPQTANSGFVPAARGVSQVPNVSAKAGSVLPKFNVWTFVVTTWLIGFAAVLLRGAWRFGRFSQLLARAGARDEEATAFVHGLLKQVRGTEVKRERGPVVLRLPVRVSPMLFGFGSRAYIVCPDQLWHLLSEQERHAFLAHETAHYCRRDHWVRWLEWMVTAAYWWFPESITPADSWNGTRKRVVTHGPSTISKRHRGITRRRCSTSSTLSATMALGSRGWPVECSRPRHSKSD